jgi:hypothetical protein
MLTKFSWRKRRVIIRLAEVALPTICAEGAPLFFATKAMKAIRLAKNITEKVLR